MAIRLFALMAFFAIVVLYPINRHFRPPFWVLPSRDNGTHGNGSEMSQDPQYALFQLPLNDDFDIMKGGSKKKQNISYLWAYVIFTYLFVAFTIYSINWETFRIIRYRQDYLGSQTTVTDRTFRLTGIPEDLRSEGRIKHLIEKLDIGTVDKITLCRAWKDIDDLVAERDRLLRRLEAAWAEYLRRQEKQSKADSNQSQLIENSSTEVADEPNIDAETGENGRLMDGSYQRSPLAESERPQVTIRYGLLKLQSRKIDAIDYFEEKLRRIDAKIVEAREKDYKATDMALVTMDSVASCQMVIQARIDPRPGRLLTKLTPAPSDIVWKNTYAHRGIRRLKSWAITLFITFLTLVWIFPTALLASYMSFCTVEAVLPDFANWLKENSIAYSLLQNGLPTLVVSLLNVAVPYLYDWLSNHQGMISQGDVELSVISKNFFFTFFNTFFVFTVSKTGFDFWSQLRQFLQDTSQIPIVISRDVESLSIFYTSFIMLQGIGLMPFRILEAGSVFLYPFSRMMAKTPRDFAEMQQPPVFQYGFYLPTALLVFNLCIIYSVLRTGLFILMVGTVYFSIGYFTFKYMLVYAMDQPQHATGGAWRIICYRIVIGLLVFEVVMFGQVATLRGFVQSIVLLPLIPFTIWYSYYFKRRFEPLTRYIALRAVRSGDDPEDSAVLDEEFEAEHAPRPSQGILRRGSTLDEHREKGLVFVNPSLVVPYV
jgi:calcium permeable stress-gated cation channel